jgi:DNA-directed RNA polymerase subunit RPC12/RpoP
MDTIKIACGCGTADIGTSALSRCADSCSNCGQAVRFAEANAPSRKRDPLGRGDTVPAFPKLPEWRNPIGSHEPPEKVTQNVRCSNCFTVFSTEASEPTTPVPPCPECGSIATTVAGSPQEGLHPAIAKAAILSQMYVKVRVENPHLPRSEAAKVANVAINRFGPAITGGIES